MTITITLDKVKSYKKLKITFHQDSGIHIVKQYDKWAREFWININEYEEEINIRYFGNTGLVKQGHLCSGLVNEVIQIIDRI